MSESLINFEDSIKLARNLYEIDKSNYNNPPTIEQSVFVQALRGGAAILAIAAFENFLKNLFEEKLSVLSTNPPMKPFDTLPDRMQISSIYYSLENSMKGSRYGVKKDKIDRLPDIIDSARTIGHIIDPTCFSETGSNPNPENVKRMFKDVGINDIFGQIKNSFETKNGSPVSDSYISDTLLSIVNRRHVVAHTANALNISRSDLIETFKFLKILSECLDDHLSQFIDNI